MSTSNSPEAVNRDYRYLYLVLAKFLRLDGRGTEAQDVERKGSEIFGSDLFK